MDSIPVSRRRKIGALLNQKTAPVISALSSGTITDVSTVVAATIDNGKDDTVWSVEYGTITAYGSTATGATITDITEITKSLTGLLPYQLYHWRIKAVNSVGTSYSDDQTFTTLIPAELTDFGTRVAADSGTLFLDSDNHSHYLAEAIRDSKATGLFPNASLLMIPSARKASKLYSILPIDGTGDFVYARTGNKWVRNNLGAYASNADNLPCLDWDGEKYRYSAELGTTNTFLTPAAPATQTRTVVDNYIYTISCKGSGSITLSGAGSGVVTEANPVVFTSVGTSLTLTVAGSLTHAQIEGSNGAVTTPIFGAGGYNTRVKDYASLSSVETLIGQIEGTIFIEIENTQKYPSGIGGLFRIWTDASNYINCFITRNAANITVTSNVYVGGTAQASLVSGNFITEPQNLKIAIAYKANDYVMYINGVKQAVDTSATVPTCSKIDLANLNNASAPCEGVIMFAISKTRLTDTQLGTITDVEITAETMLAESTALFARMDSTPTTNLQNFINEAITDLKAAGIWERLDKLVFSNLHTWKSSLLDFMGGRGMFPRGAWTAKTGFAYGGDRGYVDTLFRPSGDENIYTSTEDNNYVVDDAMVAVYSQTNIIPGAGVTGHLLGTVINPGDDEDGPVTIIRLTSANIEYCLNEPVADIKTLAHSNSVSGLIVLERGADDSLDLHKNGVKTSVASDEATGFPANELRVLMATASGNTIGMFAAGKSLGALNAEFYRIVNKFMIQVSSGLPSDLKTGRYQTTQPMLTIRMDDGYAGQYGGWKTLLDSYGVKPAWAILTDVIDGLAAGYPDHATWANVEDAYAAGWEITLHGEEDVSMTDLTIEEMQAQILSAKSKLESHGIEVLHYNMHNYSFSAMYAREIGARYFRSVSAGWGFTLPSETNPNIIDPYNLSGMAADLGPLNGSPAYTLTTPEGIALLKAQLDIAAANNRWAIIIVHDYSAEKAAGMAEIIEYAQSLNINFVTHEEALNSCTLI